MESHDYISSLNEFVDLRLDLLQSGGKTHVHEFGFSVHLETTLDRFVNGEVKLEVLTGILWVGLEGREDLGLLAGAQGVSRDDGDLLLLVELLIKLSVFLSDGLDEGESLVLSQNLQELNSKWVEIGDTLQSIVEFGDFLDTDTSVLGEKLETLGVIIEALDIGHIFVDGEEGFLLGGGGEENGGISSLDGVLL